MRAVERDPRAREAIARGWNAWRALGTLVGARGPSAAWDAVVARMLVGVVGALALGAGRVSPLGAQATITGERGSLTPWVARYHTLEEVLALLAAWESERPDALRLVDWSQAHRAPSESDRQRATELARVPAVELFGPGAIPPEQRPTILLVGAADGTSLVGGEAVLAVLSELARDPNLLPSGVTFLALPWAAPEAFELFASGGARDGRDREPVDEDRDGALDEDGPDDIDGDGVLLEMLVPTPDGPWVLQGDGPGLRRAEPGDGPRYQRTLEGIDDDRDGRFNADGVGGIVLDRSFPIGWPSDDPLAGSLPLAQPNARALADLCLERRVVVALVYGGDHGLLALPGGFEPQDPASALTPELPAPEDRPAFERLTALWNERLGRDQELVRLRDARQRSRPGALVDWLYAVPGALAVEVAPWGPRVALELDGVLGNLAELPTDLDAAWLSWLDNARGGLGFSPWRPVDLGLGRRGLIGGFDASTRVNPPADRLAAVLDGQAEFVRDVAEALPRLEIFVLEARREKELLVLRARVHNGGLLPTASWPLDRWRGRTAQAALGITVALELASDAGLLAGSQTVQLERLAGGSSSRDLEWLILAPSGSPIAIEVRAPWSLPVRREVKR